MPADVKSIFLAATETPTDLRAAYLDGACAGDAALRQRVEALLRVHDEPTEVPAASRASPTAAYAGFTPPTPEELAPLFPALEILELLGAGGMGAVYKVRQPALDRLVALKILPRSSGEDSAFAERFTREARTLAKLSHPGIVPVYDFGTAGGLYWFIMEFMDGVNLRQAHRTGTGSPALALAVVPQICDALQYAHDEGVVHRDIKPENVLLDRRGRVKVADFGLAKLLGRGPEQSHLTGTYQAMGTPHYMAPEQWERPLDVDHRADIYSLGVLFYELLTGELPLGRFAPPSQKAGIDGRLDDVVMRTLAKEPERRYQRVGDVKADVEQITATHPPTTLAPQANDVRFARSVAVPLLYLLGVAALLECLMFATSLSSFNPGRDILPVGLTIVLVMLYLGLPLAGVLTVRWLARRRGLSMFQWVWQLPVVHRLRAEPFVGYATILTAATAVGAHVLPWCDTADVGQRPTFAMFVGINIRNYGIPSAIFLTLATALAFVVILIQLPRLHERVLRGMATTFIIVALGFQVAMFSRLSQPGPGFFLGTESRSHSAKVTLVPTWGLYIALALTVLGLVLSVLRLLDRSPPDRIAAATRTTV